MRLTPLLILSILIPHLAHADKLASSVKESLDKTTGRGSYIVSVSKNCDSNVQEFEKYNVKAKALCEENGFRLIDFDSAFANGGCSVEYLFKCDTTYPAKKAAEEATRSGDIKKAKEKCESLGFEKDSGKFRNCVMELIK